MSILSFTKAYIGLSSKLKYRWENSHHSGAGKYRGDIHLIYQNPNCLFTTMNNKGFSGEDLKKNKLYIAIDGSVSENILQEIIFNLLLQDISEISEHLIIHQIDITFLALLVQPNNQATFYCYSGLSSSPLYIASRMEKQFLMAAISSEAKCLSSKFDLSRKNDDCIRRLKPNTLLIAKPHGCENLSFQYIDISSSPLPQLSLKNLNNSLSNISSNKNNIIIALHKKNLYSNLNLAFDRINNLRTLIYYTESNTPIVLIISHLIYQLLEQNTPSNNIIITFIGNNSTIDILTNIYTLTKYCSRYQVEFKSQIVSEKIINSLISNKFLYLIKRLNSTILPFNMYPDILKDNNIGHHSQEEIDQNHIDDIYCEFFGEINRGGKLDLETDVIHKRVENDGSSSNQITSDI
jgi:hypothetical protein